MIYTHILTPTDFSPLANQALSQAFEEAQLHHAKLTLLHVLQHHAATEVYYIKGTSEDLSGLAAEFGNAGASPGTVPP